MSAVSRFCLNTGKEIKNKLNIPVVFTNENYSSTEAEGFIENHLNLNLRKNDDLIDQLSADIILQTHFNEIDSLNSTEKI
jgi:putative Holliday junction resolvase